MSATRDPYRFHCHYCGRQWDTEGMTRHHNGKTHSAAATGFIASAANSHEGVCKHRTPSERRATNVRDEKRWLKSPPVASRIWNDPKHPGLKDSTQ